jgi:hypothetical protein
VECTGLEPAAPPSFCDCLLSLSLLIRGPDRFDGYAIDDGLRKWPGTQNGRDSRRTATLRYRSDLTSSSLLRAFSTPGIRVERFGLSRKRCFWRSTSSGGGLRFARPSRSTPASRDSVCESTKPSSFPYRSPRASRRVRRLMVGHWRRSDRSLPSGMAVADVKGSSPGAAGAFFRRPSVGPRAHPWARSKKLPRLRRGSFHISSLCRWFLIT